MEFDREVETNLNSDHAYSFDDLTALDQTNEKSGDNIPSPITKDDNIEKQQLVVTDISNILQSNELKKIDANNLPVFTEIKTNTANDAEK